MKFKMKGHTLPGPSQRKESPTKILSFIEHGGRTTGKNLRARVAKVAEDRIKQTKEVLDGMSEKRGYDKVEAYKTGPEAAKLSDKIKSEKTGYMGT